MKYFSDPASLVSVFKPSAVHSYLLYYLCTHAEKPWTYHIVQLNINYSYIYRFHHTNQVLIKGLTFIEYRKNFH